MNTQQKVDALIAAVRKQWPRATWFSVTSSDQGNFGYLIYAVGFDDSTVVDSDSGIFSDWSAELNDQPFLEDLDWRAFGDRGSESTFDVDMTTKRIIR